MVEPMQRLYLTPCLLKDILLNISLLLISIKLLLLFTTQRYIDSLCVLVSLLISLQFLETLDTIVIPRDYPAISSEAVDRTIFEPLSLIELQARLTMVSAPGWRVDSNRKTVCHLQFECAMCC